MRYVVDTNIWIEFLRKHPKVRARLRERVAQRHEICIIPIVYFELLRGLEKRRDLTALAYIERYWSTLPYYECTKIIWNEAVRQWVIAIRQNNKREDADFIIAAFAIQLNATIVTRNVRHFSIFQLPVENWIDD